MSGIRTGENFEVDVKSWREADAIHLWRYFNARGFIEENDIVLDLGCGHGYGSAILARSLAKRVVGYDYDERVMNKRAVPLYQNDKVEFVYKDIEKEELSTCDYMVCIEVLEHVKDPDALVNKMKDSTRRVIFVSTPIVPMTGKNEFHENDFTVDEVHKLFRDGEWEILKWANLGGENGLFLFYSKAWQKSL